MKKENVKSGVSIGNIYKLAGLGREVTKKEISGSLAVAGSGCGARQMYGHDV